MSGVKPVTATGSIRQRIEDILGFLSREYPAVFTEQRHLDAGTEARAYWHHGYMMGLRDVERQMEEGACQTKQ
jgi:hypothetical protein